MKKAIFRAQGRQLRAAAGEYITVNRIAGDIGSEHVFSEVLAIESGGKIALGAPYLEGAVVRAELVENMRGPKLRILRMRRRKKSRTRMGFRADLSKLRIIAVDKG